MPLNKSGKDSSGFGRQLSMILQLPFVLVGSVGVGGAIGYFLDLKFHTAPWLLLVCGLLGFGAGIKEVLRELNQPEKSGRSGNQNDNG